MGEQGEYGVGGLSASDEATLDFLRVRSGFCIELVGDLIETASVNDGVRGGKSYVLSSFSKKDGVLGDTRSRKTTRFDGRMPYSSSRWLYWLGRRHDSNSASSSGVTARNEKPRILLRDLVHTKRTARVRAHTTSEPATAPMMM